MRNKEQIESELRTIIKNSKKGMFVNLTLTNLIEISRRMYFIYENFKSGDKFKIKNDNENILILNNVLADFKKLNNNIDNIPNYLKDLIDRRWEQTPNTKESLYGSTRLLQKKLKDLEEKFKSLTTIFSKELKDGNIIMKKWWQINFDDSKLNFKKAAEKLEYLIEDSVKIRLTSDVKVVSMLSGGIDSGIISNFYKKNYSLRYFRRYDSSNKRGCES